MSTAGNISTLITVYIWIIFDLGSGAFHLGINIGTIIRDKDIPLTFPGHVLKSIG